MNEVLRQILDFGMADILNKDYGHEAEDYHVAAGDPVSPIKNCGGLIDCGNIVDNHKQFVICGNSMSPQGINNGDNVLGRVFDISTDKICEGDFFILKVDPNYYNGEKPKYKHKLRCAIMIVPQSWSENDIVEKMKTMDSQPEIWLKSYQKCLHEKLEKARNHYKNKDLILSCTYKNGNLRYSFHDMDFIEYKVVSRINKKEDRKIKDTKMAA